MCLGARGFSQPGSDMPVSEDHATSSSSSPPSASSASQKDLSSSNWYRDWFKCFSENPLQIGLGVWGMETKMWPNSGGTDHLVGKLKYVAS